MVCPFPQKLLISHLSLKWPHVSTQGEPGPTTTKEKNNKKKRPSQTSPPQKKKKKKKRKKRKKKKRPERKKKKEKKEGTIFVNPPSEDSLVDEPSYGKGS